MDLGIKELGITLIVGVFTLLGAEIIARFLFNHPLTTFFHDVLTANKPSTPDVSASAEEKERKEATVTVATFAALVFAVGMVVETISFKYVDDQNLFFKTLPASVMGEGLTRKVGMPPADDDRVAALFGSLENPQRWSLATDLAHSNAFLISDSNQTGQRVQNWLNGCALNSCDCATREDIQTSVENLYYYAKNMAYSDENHYQELGHIQSRLEFARSLSLIGLLGFFVVTGFVIIQVCRGIYRWMRNRGTAGDSRKARIGFVAGAFFLAYLFGLWAYAGETQAFNRRAFGYLSSHLIQERRASAQAIQLESDKAKVQAAKDSAVAAVETSATKAGPATK